MWYASLDAGEREGVKKMADECSLNDLVTSMLEKFGEL